MRSFRCFLALIALVFAVAASPSRALAQADHSCQVAKRAEALEAEGRLTEARSLLQSCVNAQCGGDVRRGCAVQLQKLSAITPSVVVRVEDEQGDDVVDVEVRLGDETLATSLDGMAIPIDPGSHEFEFRRPGYRTVRKKLEVSRGEKFQVLEVRMDRLDGPPGSGDPADESSLSGARVAAGATLIGVGVVGMAGFTWLGLKSRSRERQLERCSPGCSKGLVASVRKRYVLANVTAGVSVLALGAATWVLLSGPEESREEPPPLDVAIVPGGAFATYSGSF